MIHAATRLCAHCIYITLVCLLAAPAHAVQQMKMQFAGLDGEGWHAEQVELIVKLGADSTVAYLTVKRLQLNGVSEPARDVVVECAGVELLDERFACAQARIAGQFPYIGKQRLSGMASYARRGGAIAMQLQNLKLAKGDTSVATHLQDDGWQVVTNSKQTDLGELLKLAQHFVPDAAGKDFNVAGQVDAAITARGRGSLLNQLEWQLQASKLNASNSAGTLASDSLALDSRGGAIQLHDDWQFDVQFASRAGQAYAEPVFVDMTKHPLNAHAKGTYLAAGAIQLDQLQLEQQGVVNATANGRLALQDRNLVPSMQVQIVQLQFPGTFDTYLQPFLIGTGFKNLKTNGSLRGSIVIQNTWPAQVDLEVKELGSDDGNKSLVFNGVNGELHWRDEPADATSASSDAPASHLSWRSGVLLGLELGATRLPLELWGTNLRIAEPTRIPIFNGALAIDAFRVRKAGTPQMAFMLDANIEPINVAQLCRAFGWPEFGGELSGRVTKLRLEQDTLTLGATLAAKVFAGEVAVSNMRLEGALSQWPRFNADIKLDNLDLQQVTQAFSFGLITGRLSGEINGLSLFNWQPAAMNARLYTPDNDRSKHRISQRAVQNIGSIGGSGGGVSAALQTGFLRFFEDFNYDKIGISCRLENDVCTMNGVAPADNGGYYLVKGSGVPRIDVIGNSTRVDWPRLVAQLKAATAAGAPVVK